MSPPTSVGLRTNARRVEAYARATVYVLFASAMVAETGVLISSTGPESTLVLLAVIVHASLSGWLVHRAFTEARNGTTPLALLRGHPLLAGAWSLAAVAAVSAMIVLHGKVTPLGSGVLVVSLCAVTPVLSFRAATLAALVVGAVGGGALTVGPNPEAGSSAVLLGIMITLSLALSIWASVWTVRVVWELEEARFTSAELAIAQERLRFSRDLHDIIGRTLTAVAVTSEMAAQLARRGHPERAAEEMGRVRKLAEDSTLQVRAVVQGYRALDLGNELEGARSLLASAGVDCTVAVNSARPLDAALPDHFRDALAAVAREAVTNVLRHSRAGRCEITMNVSSQDALLEIANDGVTGPDRVGLPGHTGLVGLAERLEQYGGQLDHTREDGWFRLRGSLPIARRLEPVSTAPGGPR